jgi:hypothetical protein
MVVPSRLLRPVLSINSSFRAIPLQDIPPSVLFLAFSALYPEHPSHRHFIGQDDKRPIPDFQTFDVHVSPWCEQTQ